MSRVAGRCERRNSMSCGMQAIVSRCGTSGSWIGDSCGAATLDRVAHHATACWRAGVSGRERGAGESHLARGLRALEVLAVGSSTAAEVARTLDVNRSTALRL